MKLEDEIKQEKFQDHHQKAILNLIFTANCIMAEQQDFFKQFKVTGQQFNMLRILRGQFPNSISATEIKSRMLDRNSDVSRLIDRLIAKNLITKEVCESDRRSFDIKINQHGLNLLEKIGAQQYAIDHYLKLTEEEAIQLSDLLDKARG